MNTSVLPRCWRSPSRQQRLVGASASATAIPSQYTTVKPAGDRVLVKPSNNEAKSAGGILLPTAADQTQTEGTVISVGEVQSIEEGSEIMFSRYAGTKVKIGDEEHIIMKEGDIIGTRGDTLAALKPTEDRILIKVAESEDTSSGGVILTAASSEKPTMGAVVAVGPGKKGEDGNLVSPGVNAGDQVLYSKYSGTDLEDGDDKYIVVRSTDILAVLA